MEKSFINGTSDGQNIKDFKGLDKNIQDLITAAIKAREHSYSPYSKFAVGAAIRTDNGEIYTGCNVENATLGGSICAERTACLKAISDGHRIIKEVAVVAQQEKSFTAPCGLCRQFLYEFTDDNILVYVAKPSPCRVLCTTILDLLPNAFKTYLEN